MPFISTVAREDAASSSSIKDDYLNPSSIKSRQKVRFKLLAEEPSASTNYGVTKLTIQKDASHSVLRRSYRRGYYRKLGDDYVRSLSRDGKMNEPLQVILYAVPYITTIWNVYKFSWTQKTITQQFDVISQLEDYEDMTECDFYLSREGQGTDTKYTVQAAPLKKAMAKTVDEAWESEKEFDLARLLKGGNPFKEEE